MADEDEAQVTEDEARDQADEQSVQEKGGQEKDAEEEGGKEKGGKEKDSDDSSDDEGEESDDASFGKKDDEPANEVQMKYLRPLAEAQQEEIPDDMSEADAADKINEMQENAAS
jgi:hypothetical protein